MRAAVDDHGFDTASLREDVHLLRARSTYWPAPGNIVAVEDPDGLTLFDCGFGTEPAREALDTGLRSLGYEFGAVHTVVVTHPHVDHAGGLALVEPGTRILGPVELAPALQDPGRMAEMVLPDIVRGLAPHRATHDVDVHFREDCGATQLDLAVTPLAADSEIVVGRTRWIAVSTPGHEAGLYSYFEPQLGLLVCSDLLSARGTAIPWYAPGGGGTRRYLDALDRVAKLDITLALRGHGTAVHGRDDVRDVIQDTADRITSREARLAAALAERPHTFPELEEMIYPHRVYDVIPWAASVVATHLLEGIEEARIEHRNDRFELVRSSRGRG
jgi:glyoxylase-like metal-dependent hydrolase (beta-lactamase superfamily II)